MARELKRVVGIPTFSPSLQPFSKPLFLCRRRFVGKKELQGPDLLGFIGFAPLFLEFFKNAVL
jgi:hypothetical protein